MRKQTILLLFPILLTAIVVSAQAGPPLLPLILSGNVTINGEPAPAGTLVEAKADDIERAEYLVTQEEGKYLLTIPGASGDTNRTVEIFVNRVKAAEVLWKSGDVLERDLAIEIELEFDISHYAWLVAIIIPALALIAAGIWLKRRRKA
jgi:hypothetical protein